MSGGLHGISLAPLSGYEHGIGGIGPHGAGFYRYAPAVPALKTQSLTPAAYLRTAPVIKPANIKVMTERHLEYFVSIMKIMKTLKIPIKRLFLGETHNVWDK